MSAFSIDRKFHENWYHVFLIDCIVSWPFSEPDAQQGLREKCYLNNTLIYKRNSLPWVIMKMSKRFLEIDNIPLTEINTIFISLYVFIYNILRRMQGLVLILVARPFSLKHWRANGFTDGSSWNSFCISSYFLCPTVVEAPFITGYLLLVTGNTWTLLICSMNYTDFKNCDIYLVWHWIIFNSCQIFLSSFLRYRLSHLGTFWTFRSCF